MDHGLRAICGDLLECLRATDRLCGHLGAELGAMCTALPHRRETPLRRAASLHRVTIVLSKKADHLNCHEYRQSLFRGWGGK